MSIRCLSGRPRRCRTIRIRSSRGHQPILSPWNRWSITNAAFVERRRAIASRPSVSLERHVYPCVSRFSTKFSTPFVDSSTQSEIDAIKWISTDSLPLRFEHDDPGSVSAKNEAMPRADQWTSGKIDQRDAWLCWRLIVASTSLISVKMTTISAPCWFNRVDIPSMPIVSPRTSKLCTQYALSFSWSRWTPVRCLESRGCWSIEQTDASFEYELSVSTVPSIGEHLDSPVRFHGLLRRPRVSIRTDSPRSFASSHAASNPS